VPEEVSFDLLGLRLWLKEWPFDKTHCGKRRRNMKHLVLLILFVALVAVTSPTNAAAQAGPTLAGCPVLPADNIWNTPIDDLPVDINSNTYVSTIGADRHLHPDFGAGLWDGGPIGIPYNMVPGSQPEEGISFDYADESDPGPYPIPPDAAVEGGPSSTGDRHILVLDRDNCVLYETWSTYRQPDGSWYAGSGAVFSLASNALRPSGWTSADAAGLPILPGLVRYDEVASGEISHALRFTAPQTRRAFVWPARHFASSLTGTSYPPMGQRFRLEASFDISTFSPEMQVILRALKKYGMILADNGSAWYISGVPDERWNNDVLVSEFGRVYGHDFEAIDESGLMVGPDSGQARQSGADLEPPTAPTNLVATPRSASRIDLTWNPSTDNVGVTNYRVYRNGTQIATASGTSYQNAGLQPASTYTYRVIAFDAAGNGSPASNEVSATTLAALPTAPSSLAATAFSRSQINLAWSDNSNNETGFTIERCQGSTCTNFLRIASVVANVRLYSDSAGPSSNTTYRYRVCAYNAGGKSAYSNIARATTKRR
jgi:hypothetical protein